MKVGLYLVAYFDLLGQSDELNQLPSIAIRDEEVVEIGDVIGTKAATILQVREQLAEWQRQAVEVTPEKMEHLAPESRPQYARIAAVDTLRFTGFSDSFVLSCKVSDSAKFEGPEAAAKAANAICSTLTAVAGISLITLADGVPIRGGIEVGFAVDMTANEVYGRVLMDAYNLECRYAEYPRTIIGPNLITLLRWLRSLDENQSVASGFAVAQSKQCLDQLICGTDDGFPMVHFLSNFFLDADRKMTLPPGGVPLGTLRADAQRWVMEQENIFGKKGDHKLRARYHRLRRYFEQYPWSKPARS